MALKLILPSFLLKKEDRENRTALPASWRSGESRERERGREALLRSYCATSGRPGLHYSKQSDRREEIFIQYLVSININT